MKKLYIEPTTEALELTLGSSLLNSSLNGESDTGDTDMGIDILEGDVWSVMAF